MNNQKWNLLSCFSLQVEHPPWPSGTSSGFLWWMEACKEGYESSLHLQSGEKRVLQASPKGCLSVRIFPTKSFFVLKMLLTWLHFQENSRHTGSDQGEWLDNLKKTLFSLDRIKSLYTKLCAVKCCSTCWEGRGVWKSMKIFLAFKNQLWKQRYGKDGEEPVVFWCMMEICS